MTTPTLSMKLAAVEACSEGNVEPEPEPDDPEPDEPEPDDPDEPDPEPDPDDPDPDEPEPEEPDEPEPEPDEVPDPDEPEPPVPEDPDEPDPDVPVEPAELEAVMLCFDEQPVANNRAAAIRADARKSEWSGHPEIVRECRKREATCECTRTRAPTCCNKNKSRTEFTLRPQESLGAAVLYQAEK